MGLLGKIEVLNGFWIERGHFGRKWCCKGEIDGMKECGKKIKEIVTCQKIPIKV